MNDLVWKKHAADAREGAQYRILDVWPTLSLHTVDDYTQDGRHPALPVYHLWNQLWLEALSHDKSFEAPMQCAQLSGDPSWTNAPSREPSEAPSKAPSKAPCNVDGFEDGSESDVDCGGPNDCVRCAVGDRCLGESDCATRICTNRTCTAPLADAPTRSPTHQPTRSPTQKPKPTAPITSSPTDAPTKYDSTVYVPAFVDDDARGYGAAGGVAGNHAVRDTNAIGGIAELRASAQLQGWHTAFRSCDCENMAAGLQTLLLALAVLVGGLLGSCAAAAARATGCAFVPVPADDDGVELVDGRPPPSPLLFSPDRPRAVRLSPDRPRVVTPGTPFGLRKVSDDDDIFCVRNDPLDRSEDDAEDGPKGLDATPARRLSLPLQGRLHGLAALAWDAGADAEAASNAKRRCGVAGCAPALVAVVELFFWLAIAAFCDSRAPASVLPAFSR
ncbi:hypothetical protein M885DRAFT_139369 [Pelagophyceae sp. CCMP2097]|nr:hypothetical protein M885DRAFT_139369 [Pelagophyceae sp. CCMP2097]